MTHKISVPFGEFIFLHAQEKHVAYFRSQFLPTSFDMPTKISLTIEFKESLRVSGRSLEGRYLANGDYFYIADTKGNLAGVNVTKLRGTQLALVVDRNFDLYYLYSFLLEPLLIVKAAEQGVLFVHASAVADKHDQATLFTAWRHTGKTDRILHLTKQGFSFLGDDYCVIYRQNVYLYPKKINVFSYNLKRFPEVFAHLPIGLRLRLAVTTSIKQLLDFFAKALTGSLAKVFHRLAELAEVTTNFKIDPAQLGISGVSSAHLDTVILLEKGMVIEPTISTLPAKLFAEKLIAIMRYELQEFYQLYQAYQYLFPDQPVTAVDRYEANARSLIEKYIKQYQLCVI